MTMAKLEIWLMAASLLVCTIITIITEFHILVPIQQQWIKDIISVFISFVFSLSFIFGLLKSIILVIWHTINKKYYLGGKWYVIYHEDTDKPTYIRSGTVILKQYIDRVKMYNLLMRTPLVLTDGTMKGLDDHPTLDNDPKHKVSTGSGEYYIDFENLILKGYFNLFRGENNGSIMGLDICTIHLPSIHYKSPQHLSGNFYNAEKGRKKPMSGVIVLYKNKGDAEKYLRDRLITGTIK